MEADEPESWGVVSLMCLIRNCKRKGGRRTGVLGSHFLIVFNKKLKGKGRPEDPESSGVIALLFFPCPTDRQADRQTVRGVQGRSPGEESRCSRTQTLTDRDRDRLTEP